MKNILLILTDQQSFKMMSCVRNRYLITPAMDSLAARGVRFDLAYCTNPVCVPSRFSLVTGRYPSEIGMRSNYCPGKIPENILKSGLGHAITSAGYKTMYGGKEHFPGGTPAKEFGFDYFCHDERENLARACADFIKSEHGQPFFLTASFINPHDICFMAINDYAADEQSRKTIQNGKVEGEQVKKALAMVDDIPEDIFWQEKCPLLPDNYLPQSDEPEAIFDMLARSPFKLNTREKWDDKIWRLHRWVYHRLTEQVDRQIEIVLKALNEANLTQETVVIFTSDHGDHDASHKLEHKTAFYEEAIRVPLIICDPDTATPGSLDQQHLVSNGLDIYPTICDYAGVQVPSELMGRSLRPIAMGYKPEHWRDNLLIESEIGSAVRTEDYLYVNYDQGNNREQLYDLKNDPGQTTNFINNSTCNAPQAAFEQLRKNSIASK
jgi:arylsulfatase A-like enzyme